MFDLKGSSALEDTQTDKIWLQWVFVCIHMWMWTWRTAVIWGFALRLGHSGALRSLHMCVYIFARFWSGSSERIIWLHRKALLQFSLAGVWAGVCLRIPLGQHWCVRPRPLKPGVLFKTASSTEQLRLMVFNQGTPPAVQHLRRGQHWSL